MAAPPCLTDAEIDAAVGEQVRSGVPYVDTRALPNRPLCSGLTLAQAIQRIRAAAFPQDQARGDAVSTALVEGESEIEATAPSPVVHIDRAVNVKLAVTPRAAKPARAARAKRRVASRSSPANAHAAYFASCRAARAAGAAPLYRGSAGYSRRLDRDGDGVACE